MHLSGYLLEGRLLIISANITLSEKGLPGANKYSSLFVTFVNCVRKKNYNTWPISYLLESEAFTTKLFTAVIFQFANKL